MMISIPNARLVLETLEALVPDPQIDFGPAYEGWKKRQEHSIGIMKRYISDANKILVVNGRKPV